MNSITLKYFLSWFVTEVKLANWASSSNTNMPWNEYLRSINLDSHRKQDWPEDDAPIDLKQPNYDLPDNLQFHDMGLAERVNDHLDDTMNDRDFRQRCIQANGRNYALYEKRAIDFKPPNYKDPEWLSEKLNIEYDLAFKLAKAFDALDFNRKVANKILYGYTKPNGIRTTGLISYHGDKSELIERLDEIAASLQEVTIDPDGFIPYDEKTISDDEFDDTSQADLFGAFPLYWENEALSHEFLTMIKGADLTKINEIQKGFYPSINRYTGRSYAPKYWYMTSTQKSQAWIYINERKAKIAVEAKQALTKKGKEVLSWIKELGRNSQSSEIINHYAEGRSYKMFGYTMEFNEIPKPEEVSYIWAEYKKS